MESNVMITGAIKKTAEVLHNSLMVRTRKKINWQKKQGNHVSDGKKVN
tara:strand:- start:110 stop:253 length:144 start_codon:yes stop_codon:yes gene_type:complete